MSELEIISIGRDAIWLLLKISAPIMLIALGVGLLISLIQALTQIQEATISFVPKIVAIFVGLVIFIPFIFTSLKTFTAALMAKIAGG